MEVLSVKEIISAVGGKLLAGEESLEISSISTNSKEVKEGTLFVPIIGERVDAHDFIEEVFELGATATFTSRSLEQLKLVEGKVYIFVDNTLEALQKLATYYRTKHNIPIIGITGSVGKTTTKEMIAAALETKYQVLKTAGNMNSQVGLPLTVFRIESNHEVAVIEMGMSNEGEIKKLSNIVKPTMAVITNIGVSHIGQLGSKENIRKEKMNIIDACNCNNEEMLHQQTILKKPEYSLYLNGDDFLLREIIPYQSYLQQAEEKHVEVELTKETKESLMCTKIKAYGMNPLSDFYAKDVQSSEGNTYFTFVYPEGEERIKLQVLGSHNVMNAVAALGIAWQLQIHPSIAKVGLEHYQPIAMRGQIYQVKDIQIIDDSYNASPDSMKSSLEVLASLDKVNRRVAVLADVLELGKASYRCHYQVGEFIAKLRREQKNIDEVICVGVEARAIIEALLKEDDQVVTHCFSNNAQVIEYLKASLKEKDAVMVKGSRGMKTDEIVKGLLQ